MKKILTIALAFAAMAVISGCASVVPRGGIFTDLQLPVQSSGNTLGSKVGVASCESILGFVATGDASIQAAAKNGGITKISHVDWKVLSEIPLGIKTVYTTTVYGE